MNDLFYQLVIGHRVPVSVPAIDSRISREPRPERSRTSVTLPPAVTERSGQSVSCDVLIRSTSLGRNCSTGKVCRKETAVRATPLSDVTLRETFAQGLQELARPFEALSAAVCAAIVGCLLALLI